MRERNNTLKADQFQSDSHFLCLSNNLPCCQRGCRDGDFQLQLGFSPTPIQQNVPGQHTAHLSTWRFPKPQYQTSLARLLLRAIMLRTWKESIALQFQNSEHHCCLIVDNIKLYAAVIGFYSTTFQHFLLRSDKDMHCQLHIQSSFAGTQNTDLFLFAGLINEGQLMDEKRRFKHCLGAPAVTQTHSFASSPAWEWEAECRFQSWYMITSSSE